MRDHAALIFAFTLGVILGAFTLLISPGVYGGLRGLSGYEDARVGDADDAVGTSGSRPSGGAVGAFDHAGAADPALAAELTTPDRAAALELIAQRLEAALFDGDLAEPIATLAATLRSEANRLREIAVDEAVASELDVPEVTLATNDEGSLALLRFHLERQSLLRDLRARRNDATALIDRSDPEAIETLVRLFTGAPEPEVRADAALVLALSGSKEARTVLADAILGTSGAVLDESGSVAAAALAVSDDPHALARLVKTLTDARDPSIRLLVLGSLEGAGPLARGEAGAIEDAIAQALREDADPGVRRQAAIALIASDLASLSAGRAALADSLHRDDDAEVRLAVVDVLLENHRLTRERLPEAQAALLDAVATDASVEVRGRAIEALSEIGDASAADALETTAAGLAAELAPAAADAVRRIRDRTGDRLGSGG